MIQVKYSLKVIMTEYMLIDNSGNAWIPSKDIMSYTNFSYDLSNNVIIGNICNQKDWTKICAYLKNIDKVNIKS